MFYEWTAQLCLVLQHYKFFIKIFLFKCLCILSNKRSFFYSDLKLSIPFININEYIYFREFLISCIKKIKGVHIGMSALIMVDLNYDNNHLLHFTIRFFVGIRSKFCMSNDNLNLTHKNTNLLSLLLFLTLLMFTKLRIVYFWRIIKR